MPTQKTCTNCKHFRSFSPYPYRGECHAHPPGQKHTVKLFGRTILTLSPETEFPVVNTDHSCGLFDRKKLKGKP